MSRFEDMHDAVVSAEIHDITAARMTRSSPVLEEAWRYWNAKRVGGDLPRRDALDPRAMQLILGHAMILDRVRHGTVRVRVGGRVPNALMGMETRGLPIRAFFDLLQRGDAAEIVERAFDAPATVEFDLVSDGDEGSVTARMLVLPLLDREGAVSKALAVLVPGRLTTDGPRRFRIARHHVSPVRLPPRAPAPLPDPAPPTAGRRPAVGGDVAVRRRPGSHLRLVQ